MILSTLIVYWDKEVKWHNKSVRDFSRIMNDCVPVLSEYCTFQHVYGEEAGSLMVF